MTISTLTATANETGYVIGSPGSVWATVWGHAGVGGYENQQSYEAYCRIVSSEYRLSSGRLRYDTRESSGGIVAVRLGVAFNRIFHNKGDNYLHFVRAVGCGDDMATSDFGSLKDNTEDICDPIRVSDIIANTYFERELNTLGKSMINTAGYTVIGLRLDDDIDNRAPVDGSKEVWLSWYGGVYTAAPTGYEAKLIVADTGGVTSTKDWVTGIVHRVGPGHYSNELILGGLDTRWHYVDYTPEPVPAIPSEVKKEKGPWLGPFWERRITEEGMKWFMFWLSPERVKSYITLPESFAPPG